MKKRYKNIEFTIQYYKYSDHMTSAFMVVIDRIKGKHTYYTLQITDEQKHELWYTAVTKGKDVAVAEIKRIYRQQIHSGQHYILYPFWLEGKREYINTQGTYINAFSSLKDRLRKAKNQKADFEHDNWEYIDPTVTEGRLEVVNGKFEMVKKEAYKTTRRILKDSQFSLTFRTPDIWDNIRGQVKLRKEKE